MSKPAAKPRLDARTPRRREVVQAAVERWRIKHPERQTLAWQHVERLNRARRRHRQAYALAAD